MKIYNYHPITKEFVSEKEAQLDPLESKLQDKDIYILPAHATFITCPKPEANCVWCFDEAKSKWFRHPDFRGDKVYVIPGGAEVVIKDIGEIPFLNTREKPLMDFPRWNGKTWETDTDAKQKAEDQEKKVALRASDAGMARAAEDLIDILIRKGIIQEEDIPVSLKGKIVERKALRESISK